MHNVKRAAAAIGCILLAGLCGCAPDWLAGHDNGEAYEHYQKSMKEYISENGLEPDAYGYGWQQ